MPRWTGRWDGGRTYVNKQGDTVWVLEKQVHGRLYTTRLSAGNEKDALAELALFRRDPAAYVARAQEAKAAEETTPGNAPVLLDLPTVERFLGYLKSQGRTERHRKNVLHYLAQWAEVLYGKDLRQLRLQDLKQALNGWFDVEAGDIPAKRHRIAAIKAFCSWLREAGERYGKVMGRNAARAFAMLAAVALGNTATGLAAKVPTLPGAMQAAAQAETQVGLRLAAVGEVETIAVSAEAVTITLAPNAVAMSAGDGRGNGHVTGELTGGASDIHVDKVVNSNMPHAAERAVERAGFSSVQDARAALQGSAGRSRSRGFRQEPFGTRPTSSFLALAEVVRSSISSGMVY